MFGNAVFEASGRPAQVPATAGTLESVDNIVLEPDRKTVLRRRTRDALRFEDDERLSCRKRLKSLAQRATSKGRSLIADKRKSNKNRLRVRAKNRWVTFTDM